MTRSEAIAAIHAKLNCLPDEHIAVLAGVIDAWTRPTVFSTLSAADRAELDAALDSLDRGEGIDLETVAAELDRMLEAAGA